jgi:hypothetical protein
MAGKISSLVAAHALAYKQDSVQQVIVPGIFVTKYFLLYGLLHELVVFDLNPFHFLPF